MFKKILHSVIVGIVSAAVILFILPQITEEPVTPEAPIASYKDAVRIASPAVVNVYNQAFTSSSTQLKVNNLGSGVIMSKDGYILTNKHVIQNADQITL